jgi:flavin reductase (DIM6/NTAB) family NADH-FMN oxidoreductase RutF
VCARFATGVTVVTVFAHDGAPHGLTINSFTSVSLNPPLVMIAIDNSCVLLEHYLQGIHFAVNILRDTQRDFSVRFSEANDRFDGLAWKHGVAPVLEGMLAVMECRRKAIFEAGDHTIIVGEVERATVNEGKPLVFYDSNYAYLAAAPEATDRAADNAAS